MSEPQSARSAVTLVPGTRLGPYEILAPLGAGGMGEVYRARDPRLGRDVAIKVSAAQFSERFETETRAIAALNHPHICQIYDVGPNYLVMELIEGFPLKGPLPLGQALKYAAQICDALDAAHSKGITHRDLKPANILVTKTGIKLLDFGLAKWGTGPAVKELADATLTMALTGKNQIVGTLYYMSPEQLQAPATGQEIDGRSDVFSFGIVLYEMLTGKRAFEGSSPASVIAAIMERPAPSIAYVAPPSLDRVLKKCLAKNPEERWQTARDLKDELLWIAAAPADVSPTLIPGSRFIVFDGGGKLKKIEAAGGPPQTICDVPATAVGGSWNRDGVILFGLNNLAGIQRVSSTGGTPAPVTVVNVARKEIFHSYPVFLPDGRHFLYHLRSVPEDSGIYVGSLDNKPGQQSGKRLVATGFAAALVPSPDGSRGAILFDSNGTLLAQPFDLRRLGIAGEPAPLAEQLGGYLGFRFFAASRTGALAYRVGGNFETAQLDWVDRQGKVLASVGGPHNYANVALSPDGTRIAAAQIETGFLGDIWLKSVSGGNETRFTFDPARDVHPIWSPDGGRIAFSSDRAGVFDLYQHASNGAGQDELLLQSRDHNKRVTDWSRDGRFLVYYDVDPKTQADLWVLPMEEQQSRRKPVPFLRTEFNELDAKFSPDSRWIAYQSNESGRVEIYVRPFPAAEGGKWVVSQSGGTQPRWRGDGKELFYLAPDGTVMAAPVSAAGAGFQPGMPVALFKARPNPAGWDVSSDGKKFLIPVPVTDTAQAPFTVVLNWESLLRK